MATGFLDVIDSYFTCEFTTIGRSGSPQTWPVTPRLLTDGRFFMATSIGLPQKAFNIRRNPTVSLLFSDPTGSGVAQPSTVLIQGDAVCEDRIVSDVATSPDLAALAETLSARQPAGAFMSSWLGRGLFWPYYLRLLIYVTPRRALWWPDGDCSSAPTELDLAAVHRVG